MHIKIDMLKEPYTKRKTGENPNNPILTVNLESSVMVNKSEKAAMRIKSLKNFELPFWVYVIQVAVISALLFLLMM